MRSYSNRAYWRTIAVVVLLYSMASLGQVLVNGTEEGAVRLLIRYSARVSALLFSLAFSAGAIHYFLKKHWTASFLKLRPHLGLAFTISHSFHLFYLLWLQKVIHPVFTLAKTSSLLAGGTAYFLMYLMAITTFSSVKDRLPPRTWRMLHLIGGYWIWGIFFNSYLKNVLNRERFHLLLLILSLVMIMRVLHLIHRKSQGRKRSSGLS